MIELDRVGYQYPDSGQGLTEISCRIETGERVILLGANGCGKSTLLRLLNGLVIPDCGQFRYRGEIVNAERLAVAEFRRRFRSQNALVFQNPEVMFFNATVLDEIAYGPRRLGWPDAEDRARDWAGRLGLLARLDRAPFRLSGGEKQRLALAAVLVLEPELLLLDEPTASLDARATGWLVEFLLDQPKMTCLIAMQNLSLARELGERVLILSEQGSLLHDGPLAPALDDTQLLWKANLAHTHRHSHGTVEHRHRHVHEDWS